LGLASALAALGDGFGQRAGVHVARNIQPDLPQLSREAELVVYRVAQEALSNAARHSGAGSVEVRLQRTPTSGSPSSPTERGGVLLEVADDGRGFAFDESERGLGIGGMRERALLIGAELTIESRPGRGTTVRLEVPGESSA
ncbi:MAG: sensor histidine kinase, partial [Solirubrobacterales bacterium]